MDEVSKVDEGVYVLQPGDDASSVARRVYGDVHKSGVILKANPGSWDDLDSVRVPNKKGRVALMQEGESPAKMIRRMFPNQPESIYLQPFFRWNGGEDFLPLVGDLVFVPER